MDARIWMTTPAEHEVTRQQVINDEEDKLTNKQKHHQENYTTRSGWISSIWWDFVILGHTDINQPEIVKSTRQQGLC